MYPIAHTPAVASTAATLHPMNSERPVSERPVSEGKQFPPFVAKERKKGNEVSKNFKKNRILTIANEYKINEMYNLTLTSNNKNATTNINNNTEIK